MRASARLLMLAPWLLASPAPSLELAGVYYVLVHYQDAEATWPDTWHWEDRVWDFQRQGEHLIWTDYGLVTFMDVRGRFENPRSARARRIGGRWEPNTSQRREIERGLFVNLRGARILSLERHPDGWRSESRVSDAERRSYAIAIGTSATISSENGQPIFTLEERMSSPEADLRIAYTVYRVEDGSGAAGSGSFVAGSRSGRFRLWPSKLRRRVRPELAHSDMSTTMKPDAIGQWANFFPALLRPWHYLPERRVEIRTIPPQAFLDLSYLRSGARLMFEQGRAPLEIVLPSRFVARDTDLLHVRATSPGFQPGRGDVSLHGGQSQLTIELAPAENQLEGAWYRQLGERASLDLFTAEPLALRASRHTDALTLMLPGTALAAGVGTRVEAVAGGPVRETRALQLEEDLVLRLRLAPQTPPELPMRRNQDAIREQARTSLEFPPRSADAWTEQVKKAMGNVGVQVLGECAAAFEDSLASGLPREAMAHALTTLDPVYARLLRELLTRLAELSPDGALHLVDGQRLRPDRPRELEMAALEPHRVRGLQAALHHFGAALDGAGEAGQSLRGWIAPQLPAPEFAPVLAEAETTAHACRARTNAPSS
jgi:hypothetical protein